MLMQSLLPNNSTKLERAAETAIREAIQTDVPIDTLWSPWRCPIQLLPFLAWALSVDVWNTHWTEAVKRQTVANSVYVHRHKGTTAAIKKALSALDLGVEISEWFDHGGDPYTFRADVHVSAEGLTPSQINDLFAVIKSSKNARSHLEALRVFMSLSLSRHKGVAKQSASFITIMPYMEPVPEQSLTRQRAMGLQTDGFLEIGAYRE